ncbi:hypothetical protein [Actinoplanes derwentensis]|uniref:Uncharacterized protein n=1 Tax=Actinoplanes derwentensis TaxID=113562 RepID=A0A1H1S8D8_9ACTN|nr:hypothetical protein [Actinoplanes derwentensis]SDS44245.1 hypothetical protein SAMN04489716_0794 [Actinoplanes derwentensis]
MAAVFGLQLAVAGLLLVLVLVDVIGGLRFRPLLGDEWAAVQFVTGGSKLGFAVLLAVAAFGLRRGSRIAYGLSLAGLGVALLGVSLSVFGFGSTYQSFSFFSYANDSGGSAEQFVSWMSLSGTVSGVAGLLALILATAAFGLLVAGRAAVAR